MNTLKQFAAQSNNPQLVRAVVKQIGGWESFQQSAEDVANHGIDGGFCGFVYYSDTVAFATKNMDSIMESLSSDAQEFGFDSVPAFVQSFRCVGKDYSQDEIVQALYTRNGGDAKTTVFNALAWYAAETVCRQYCDMAETA